MRGIKNNIRFVSCLFSLLFICCNFVWSQTNPSAAKPMIICLDAEHGGHDAGAIGRRSKENDVNLDVEMSLVKRLQADLPNVKVIYTRSTDIFVELRQGNT